MVFFLRERNGIRGGVASQGLRDVYKEQPLTQKPTPQIRPYTIKNTQKKKTPKFIQTPHWLFNTSKADEHYPLLDHHGCLTISHYTLTVFVYSLLFFFSLHPNTSSPSIPCTLSFQSVYYIPYQTPI